jgi:4-hydroxy-tetrahydrodipicolinate reductase
MRKAKVKVVIWGFGAMGSGMARLILRKKGFEIVGICDRNPEHVGKSMYKVLDIVSPSDSDLLIEPNIEDVVCNASCDVVILATDSFTVKAAPKIKWLLEHKVNVICTAEEMAYPYVNQPELAKEMDALAKANGVTVLGTGVNPGMMMDLLVIALTGVMSDVKKIAVSRVNSLSPFGETVMQEQGVGLTLKEFTEKTQKNEIAGHIGFKESVGMMCHALGWEIDRFEQQMKPIVTKVDRKSPYGFAKAGNVAGINMTGQGYLGNTLLIDMCHPQQIEPKLGNINTGDYIDIEGTPKISMAISPEVDGGVGTIAICVNMIPHVINSRPGLKTMIDLPVPRAIMGDVRDMICTED